jgi:hypothetical protein
MKPIFIITKFKDALFVYDKENNLLVDNDIVDYYFNELYYYTYDCIDDDGDKSINFVKYLPILTSDKKYRLIWKTT